MQRVDPTFWSFPSLHGEMVVVNVFHRRHVFILVYVTLCLDMCSRVP